jgi:hypothetical protein
MRAQLYLLLPSVSLSLSLSRTSRGESEEEEAHHAEEADPTVPHRGAGSGSDVDLGPKVSGHS